MTKNLTVNTLLAELIRLRATGFGDYPVCYLYEEEGEAVRDVMRHIQVADEADGKEVHLWY